MTPPHSRAFWHCRQMRTILFALLPVVLLTLHPSAVSSQVQSVVPSPSFLADQPIVSLVPNSASTASFTFTYSYTSTLPLLLTNASSVALNVPAIFNSNSQAVQLPAVNEAGLRGYLFTSSSLTSTCARSDSTQSGRCTVNVTLAAAAQEPLVHYSLYMLNEVAYSTGYTDTIPFHTWKYYVRWIISTDLTVGFDLGSPNTNGQLTTAMYISAAQQLYSPGYPYISNGTATINTAIDQTCMLPPGEPDVPDWYIVGLYGFAATPTVSQLQLTPNVNSYYGTSGFGGYAILSLLSLVLAAGFIGLVLVRGCCMYRRWGSGLNRGSGSAGFVSSRSGPINMTDPAMFQTTAGQSGVLRTDRAAAVGATEAEIAALPTKVYVSTVDNDGEEEGDDPRCTICLDEYESNVSHITTLRCGHTFHGACVGAWLRQRRHCPLCLQLIDQAHDVKQRRNSIVPEVELVTIRPTVAVPPAQHTSELASRTRSEVDDETSVLGMQRVAMQRYSSAAQEEDVDMCAIEIATPQNSGRAAL